MSCDVNKRIKATYAYTKKIETVPSSTFSVKFDSNWLTSIYISLVSLVALTISIRQRM